MILEYFYFVNSMMEKTTIISMYKYSFNSILGMRTRVRISAPTSYHNTLHILYV